MPGVNVGNLIRMNGGLQIGAYARIAPCTLPICEATALTLRSTISLSFTIDEAFTFYANEVLGVFFIFMCQPCFPVH